MKTEWKTIRRGWRLGLRTSREQLLELIGSPQRDEGNDEESKESDETTMTWSWIAERLHMGHWRTPANAARAASLTR